MENALFVQRDIAALFAKKFPDVSLLWIARLFALIALCSLPFSTAITNVSMLIFAGATLLAKETWRRGYQAVRHPVGGTALLLFAALVLSLGYSTAPLSESALWLVKYRKLLFIPLLLIAFQGVNWSGVARWGLFASLTASLLLSITNYFNLTSIGTLYDATALITHAWVFKNHITAGLFSALLFNMSMDRAVSTQRKAVKAALYALALVTLIHVFTMLQSRTAQLITIFLVLYQIVRLARPEHNASLKNAPGRRARWCAGFFGVSCALLIIGTFIYLKGSRLTQMSAEIAAYQQRNEATSAGLRIEWARKSLALFAQRPLLGYGAASLHREFEKMTSGYDGARGEITANPHNQYLLMAAELGLAGLGLFVTLLIQMARATARLAAPSRHLLSSWLFIFSAGCLVNSLLLDFSEGYLFVLLNGILLGCAGWPGTRPQTAARGHPLGSV